jgi:hypothetical protein
MITLPYTICWKAFGWVGDRNNPLVAQNIPRFLPVMLTEQQPQEYFCSAQDGHMHMAIRPLPPPGENR